MALLSNIVTPSNVSTTTNTQTLANKKFAGVVESISGGFKYPDGTIQITAVVEVPHPFLLAGM